MGVLMLIIAIVFEVNGQQGARRLVRALLADPLFSKSEWESQLLFDTDQDGRSLLLRYVLHERRD